MHCGVEVTELSTNKQHTLSKSRTYKHRFVSCNAELGTISADLVVIGDLHLIIFWRVRRLIGLRQSRRSARSCQRGQRSGKETVIVLSKTYAAVSKRPKTGQNCAAEDEAACTGSTPTGERTGGCWCRRRTGSAAFFCDRAAAGRRGWWWCLLIVLVWHCRNKK